MTSMINVFDFHHGPEVIDIRQGGVVVFDIDGTVSDTSARQHHVLGPKKDWKAFFAGMADDPPLEPQYALAKLFAADPRWKVVYCTGRSDEHRGLTVAWLCRHGLAYDALYMRKARDRRHDTMVKAEAIVQMQKEGYVPDLVFEDRARVVDMWRDHGFKCVQVAEGAF